MINMAHFDKHHILKDHQHGFPKRHSCETQLTVTIQEIASRVSKGNQVDIILLDYAKAFDKVPYFGWESLQDRLKLLYKAHHGLVDIGKAAFLKTGDSHMF